MCKSQIVDQAGLPVIHQVLAVKVEIHVVLLNVNQTQAGSIPLCLYKGFFLP